MVHGDEIKISQNGVLSSTEYPIKFDAQQLWAPQREALLAREKGGSNVQLKQWDMQQLEAKNVEFSYAKASELGFIQAASHQQQQVAKKLWRFDATGKLLSKSLGDALQLRLSTESQALKLTTTDVYQSSLLDVDRPLGDAPKISALEVEIGEAWQQQKNHIQTKVTQQAHGEFLQIGMPGQYEQQSSSNFLKSTARYPQSNRILRIVRGITPQPNNYQKIQSLVNFVSEYIKDETEIRNLSVDEILDSPRGDCTEHALLFVTLARAAGLPAREVSGLLYLGDEKQKYSAHVWAEVEIDGDWLSVDPTWRKIGLDPGYIRIYGEAAANTTTLLALSGKTIHVKTLSFLNI